jgi:Uma2 family endonuclease
MTTAAVELVSGEEFAALPDPPEGRLELVRGKVVCVAPVGPEHGKKALKIGSRLDTFAETHRLGEARVETGYWLTRHPDTQRGPDVSFVSAERLATETLWHGAVDQAPNLAVEVVSPSQTDREVADKVQQYLDAGVARVWVVRMELKTITVHRPGGDAHTYGVGDTLSSDDAGFSVDGFALPLAELFAD